MANSMASFTNILLNFTLQLPRGRRPSTRRRNYRPLQPDSPPGARPRRPASLPGRSTGISTNLCQRDLSGSSSIRDLNLFPKPGPDRGFPTLLLDEKRRRAARKGRVRAQHPGPAAFKCSRLRPAGIWAEIRLGLQPEWDLPGPSTIRARGKPPSPPTIRAQAALKSHSQRVLASSCRNKVSHEWPSSIDQHPGLPR